MVLCDVNLRRSQHAASLLAYQLAFSKVSLMPFEIGFPLLNKSTDGFFMIVSLGRLD